MSNENDVPLEAASYDEPFEGNMSEALAEEPTWEEPVKAWKSPEKASDDKKEPKFNTSYDIIVDYSEYSTIQGLIYVFFVYQTWFGKIFWIIVLILMTSLGLYWTIQAYLDWKANPVLTTVSTTAYPVKQIKFPAVTICSNGVNDEILTSGVLRQFFEWLEKEGETLEFTPLQAARLLLQKNTSLLSALDKTALGDLKTLLSGSLFGKYLTKSYPGLVLGDDLLSIVTLMTTAAPDNQIASMVAFDGGFNPCDNSSLGSSAKKRRKRETTPLCDPGFVADTASGYCFIVLPDMADHGSASEMCFSKYDQAELLKFDSDPQVKSFQGLLDSGKLTLPPDLANSFFVAGTRDTNGDFVFGSVSINSTFVNLFLWPDDNTTTYYCLQATYVPRSVYLDLYQADCNTQNGIVCRKIQNVIPACDPKVVYKKKDTLDLLLDPKLQADKNKAIAQKRLDFKNTFRRLDQTLAFKTMFRNLWYATLPCFDVKDVTADADGDRAVLKYCEWKGVQISCAAIFNTFPTDKGMCCTFNIRRAEDIFHGKIYSDVLQFMQDLDTNYSISDSIPPKKYTDNEEPTTLPGRNKGLVLMLDAHTDLFTAGSAATDLEGFMGLVSPGESFPFLMQEGFNIRPGHTNFIGIVGTRVDSDDDLRSLRPEQRNCRFPEENDIMVIHKNYTYSNCMFECSLLYASSKIQERLNLSYTCTPWFFPMTDDAVTMCDPWESVEFNKLMVNDIPDDQCAYCLPDCTTTIYDPMVTAIPFRRCDTSNLGVSRFCTIDNPKLPHPTIFGTQVLNEYRSRSSTIPNFVANTMDVKERTYSSTLEKGDIFTTLPKTYDSYEKDIAVVQIYFRKSVVFQMGNQQRMTWIDYFSTVGGLLGLVLGMGIVSFIELIWLCMRLAAQKMNLTYLVP